MLTCMEMEAEKYREVCYIHTPNVCVCGEGSGEGRVCVWKGDARVGVLRPQIRVLQ